MTFIKAVLLVLAVAIVAGALIVASGVYHVGADTPHWGITASFIETLRNRSIETHARGISVPDLNDPKLLADGAEHYAAMCTGCHLAPGVKDSELRTGLYPMPPNLVEQGTLDPAEAFWVIKHGVKLTAMPAWGKTHSDDAIWGLVAFVKKLPNLTPEQYRQMVGDAGEHEHVHMHGEPEHGDAEHEHGHEHEENAAPHEHESGKGESEKSPEHAHDHAAAPTEAHAASASGSTLGTETMVLRRTPEGRRIVDIDWTSSERSRSAEVRS
jgi:cytochrome c553